MVDNREGPTLRVSARFVCELTRVVDLDLNGDWVLFENRRSSFLLGGTDSSSSDSDGTVKMLELEDVGLVGPRKSDAKVDTEEGRDDDLENCWGSMGCLPVVRYLDRAFDIGIGLGIGPGLWGS